MVPNIFVHFFKWAPVSITAIQSVIGVSHTDKDLYCEEIGVPLQPHLPPGDSFVGRMDLPHISINLENVSP